MAEARRIRITARMYENAASMRGAYAVLLVLAMRRETLPTLIASLTLAFAASSLVACAGSDGTVLDEGEDVEEVSDSVDALSSRSFANVTVLYQGDWSFLTRCDKWSKGRVRFACDESPTREFVDEGAWVAAPRNVYSRKSCGKMVKVCKGSACIEAKVVERSVTAAKWEGSSAVMEALGIDHGAPSCNRSWGTATGVTITAL